MSDSQTTSSIQIAPAPWNLKAESAWWFLTSLMHTPKRGETLPHAYFSGLDSTLRQTSTEEGAFRGGIGLVMILRYTDSPIGPYDELVIIPGEFTNPSGSHRYRITRIYVSTLSSVYNGRRNWNIPKELAKFTFTSSPNDPRITELRVFSATSYSPVVYSSTPFFAIRINPATWPLPAIPVDLKYSPLSLISVQPPLDASANSSEDGQISASGWSMFSLGNFKGKVTPVKWEGLLTDDGPSRKPTCGKMANGKEFPDVMPYSIGMHWKDVVIQFPLMVVPSSQS
ncbi:hypothetical protein A0H81_05844 [Grifola frondosa]|uniref:Acetoacetate decarboxylase n=1 Tax=Grifola frondosa TaxID=5627 RepID=A0A1C7MFR3_GRIFR|nr:hypothetical protein A0H81_05844 [Grifola frondosa]